MPLKQSSGMLLALRVQTLGHQRYIVQHLLMTKSARYAVDRARFRHQQVLKDPELITRWCNKRMQLCATASSKTGTPHYKVATSNTAGHQQAMLSATAHMARRVNSDPSKVEHNTWRNVQVCCVIGNTRQCAPSCRRRFSDCQRHCSPRHSPRWRRHEGASLASDAHIIARCTQAHCTLGAATDVRGVAMRTGDTRTQPNVQLFRIPKSLQNTQGGSLNWPTMDRS
jgi:hypothetical protein